jgi:hypothetical protein
MALSWLVSTFFWSLLPAFSRSCSLSSNSKQHWNNWRPRACKTTQLLLFQLPVWKCALTQNSTLRVILAVSVYIHCVHFKLTGFTHCTIWHLRGREEKGHINLHSLLLIALKTIVNSIEHLYVFSDICTGRTIILVSKDSS